MNAYSGSPMTLGNAAVASVRLIVWCLDCRHQVETDPAEIVKPLRHGHDGPGLLPRADPECQTA
jgi:hypothetical protein